MLFAFSAIADEGTLGENQRIFSTHLGYELQYRVYRPALSSANDDLPSLYVTDGQAYLEQGDFKTVLDKAISSGDIEPVLVVFLDSRNPEKLEENRRNSQFMCNTDFAKFFAAELVPSISSKESVSTLREKRVILGVSFGGLNSACFGLMLSDLFSGIAMQSPASAEHVEVVRELYEQKETLPLKMFLSVGTRNDNTGAAKRLRHTLENKGYDLTYLQVRGGHDWQNWDRLLDDVLLTFFAASK
jgi:enterochelin esterase-like enzyme